MAKRVTGAIFGSRSGAGSHLRWRGRSLVGAILLAGACPAYAQQAAPPARYDMPAQPLGAAITELARRSGIAIIAPTELVEGRSAPALRGQFTALEALQRLLEGTGLTVTRAGNSLVVKSGNGERGEGTFSSGSEEILVTGSRIRGAPVASPQIAIDEQAMRNAGHTSIAEVMRTVPQNFGGGQNPGIGNNVPEASGADISGGSSINLRGLGSDATLTLLNGHRLSYSAATQSVDISAIPFDAVERIEIVPDGASAIYGSDAVAGVANIILRRDFDGIRASARWGASTDGGNYQQQYGLLAGGNWGSGGIVAAYEFARSTPITAEQRSYAEDATPGVTLYPFLKRHNVLVTGHQDIAQGVTFAIDGLYNRRWSKSQFPLNFEGDLDVSRAESRTSTKSFAIAPSIEVQLPRGWRAELSGVYGEDQVSFAIDQYLGDLVFPSGSNCYCNVGKSIELGGDGPLFSLAGGNAQLALGIGWRKNTLKRESPEAPELAFSGSQDSRYAYGEINLPFVGPEQEIAGAHRFNVSAALRYEKYPGIDEVVTPKLGVVYAPVAGFTIKGSWGESFRSPTLLQLHQLSAATVMSATSLGGTGVPAGSTALLLSGGNPSLKPEKATTWTASVVLEPEPIPGLTIEIGWFHVRYTDRIVTPIQFLPTALTEAAYADLVDRDPAATAVLGAIAASDSFTNGTGAPFDPASVTAIVRNVYTNAGRQTAQGIDMLASYRTGLGGGELALSFNGSLLDSEQQRLAGQPVTNLAGQIFNPPNFRARGGANWSKGSLSLDAGVNYTGGVEDPRFTPVTKVEGMTTFDFTARYSGREGWMRGLDVTLSVQNLFNAKPDAIRTVLFYDTPYDSTNYSPFGRVVSFAISKTW